MKIENIEVWGFEHAIRGMRNPLESWAKSDSYTDENGNFIIGSADMTLMKKLIAGGSEHRKFMRQIFVSMDITAPLYIWKELDTYKVGTTANSTSTMHKLASTPITLDCFEIDDVDLSLQCSPYSGDNIEVCDTIQDFSETIIEHLEYLRQKYIETQDKRYWKELVRWLPESWLQTRTITMSYENLLNIVHQRKNHKLTEWHTFIDEIAKLPYAVDLIF